MGITSQERKEMDKFVKFLCLKATQIIVQGRLGKRICTNSVATPSGAEWFNLAIKDYPEIQREAKAALSSGVPNADQSLVIEISLRTSDADSLVLEVWSVGLTNKCDDVRIHHTVYNRMSMLLRSLLCVSRVTPAYKLSRQQGNEYVICYRVYMGQVSLSGLGEGFKTLRVGSVGSPAGTITMSAAYRTTKNLHVSTREISPQMYSNHHASAARPCHTLTSRLRTLSGNSDTMPVLGKGSNSPSFNIFNASISGSSLVDKDLGATFTIGTPPMPSQSPQNYIPHRTVSSNSIQKSIGGSNPVGVPNSRSNRERTIAHGFSAPAMNSHHFAGDSSQTPTVTPSVPLTSPNRKATPSHQGTTYCHWNNSKATKVKADSVLVSSSTHKSPSTAPPQGKVILGWKNSNEVAAPENAKPSIVSPSYLVSGAFVSGSKTAARARQTLAAAEAMKLPFSDLVNMAEVSDDNLSQKSDSDNGLDEKGNNDRLLPTRSESTDSLSSSKQSSDSNPWDKPPAHGQEDFVMVDLKPAFGRDDSVGDLATFYRECENIADLVMFQDNNGTETEETLLDLAKELKDFENDVSEFDEFISELQT